MRLLKIANICMTLFEYSTCALAVDLLCFECKKVKWCLSTTKKCFAREIPKLELILSFLHKW